MFFTFPNSLDGFSLKCNLVIDILFILYVCFCIATLFSALYANDMKNFISFLKEYKKVALKIEIKSSKSSFEYTSCVCVCVHIFHIICVSHHKSNLQRRMRAGKICS